MQPINPFYFDFDKNDIEQFQEESAKILSSGVLILGEYTKRFEDDFARFAGTKYAIGVNSGSTALEFLLRIKDVRGKKVLCPTNTNFATVAAILRAGADVVYLDMTKETFAPSLQMVKTAVEKHGNSVAGVMWVHIAGIIAAEFPEAVDYCHQRGLFMLEDAAHAHGSILNGKMAGNLADGGAFSFFPTKVMTTCEGGMIVTNDEHDDYIARSLRNQGKRGVNYGNFHEDFGNSSRMTEIHALIGSIQLQKLPQMLKARQHAYKVISKQLREAGISFVSADHMNAASQYKIIIHLPDGAGLKEMKATLAKEGVILGGGVYEMPCHVQPVFKGLCEVEQYPGAEQWCPRHICPPVTSATTPELAQYIGETLVKHLGAYTLETADSPAA